VTEGGQGIGEICAGVGEFFEHPIKNNKQDKTRGATPVFKVSLKVSLFVKIEIMICPFS
jgi:hypothetical protein